MMKSGWAYAGQQDAWAFAEYAFHAPTYGDSTGSGVPLTSYMVMAHTAATTIFWESDAMTGYSVDNLSPDEPLALVATRAGSDVDLTWVANEVDDDLAEYRVYRSGVSEFTPGPTNFVGNASEAEYLDSNQPGGPLFYLVTGLDIHGNESVPSNEASVGSVSPVPERAHLVFALHEAVPNPFNPSTTLSFALAVPGNVQLKTYDTAGRLVATLLNEHMGAGPHKVVWDGRDDSGRAVAAGVYLYRLTAGSYGETKRMVLVK
jgi:hypothetical protein